MNVVSFVSQLDQEIKAIQNKAAHWESRAKHAERALAMLQVLSEVKLSDYPEKSIEPLVRDIHHGIENGHLYVKDCIVMNGCEPLEWGHLWGREGLRQKLFDSRDHPSRKGLMEKEPFPPTRCNQCRGVFYAHASHPAISEGEWACPHCLMRENQELLEQLVNARRRTDEP